MYQAMYLISASLFLMSITPGANGLNSGNIETSIPQSLELSSDVAFAAMRQSTFELRSQDLHKPVQFEGVTYNKGGHFNLYMGYFTAPEFGLYVFNYTSYNSETRKVRLMKNNYQVQILSNDGRGKDKKFLNGHNILLQLEQGDVVWLILTHGKQVGRRDQSNSTLTTFSGYLLTTEVNNDDHMQIQDMSRRHKRSLENRLSLERKIRQLDSRPVTLVERHDSEGFEDPVAVDNKTATTNQKIAFSVTCTKSMIGGHMADTTISMNGAMSPELSPNGRLTFDKILVNIGGSFDISAAEFRAPTNGVYFFSYNVGKFPRKKLSVMLMKNVNEVQSIIYNDSKTRAREIQGQSLMLQLKTNDRVWLRSYNNDEYAVYSNLGNYITFSGYLVYAL